VQKQVLPSTVYVLTKADLPKRYAHMASCKVIGTYLLMREAEEGYGYHQGEAAERAIEIIASELHSSFRKRDIEEDEEAEGSSDEDSRRKSLGGRPVLHLTVT
jgi:hypothetical protein